MNQILLLDGLVFMTIFLPSITSHTKTGSTWRSKLHEVQQFGLKEIGLFLTGMNPLQRKECYRALTLLKKHHQFQILFTHAVSTMSELEYWFLHHQFGCDRFNLHPVRQYPLSSQLSEKIRSRIYIENCFIDQCITAEDLEGFAGICLDLSHYESMHRTHPVMAQQFERLLRRYEIGANHLSAIRDFPFVNEDERVDYSTHVATTDATLEYAAKLPPWMFGQYCAIELENSLEEQLDAINTLLPQGAFVEADDARAQIK